MSTSAPRAPGRILAHAALAAAPALILGIYAISPQRVLLPYVAIVPWILLYAKDGEEEASLLWFVPAAWLAWMLQHTPLFRFGWFVPPVMGSVLFVTWLPFPLLLRAIHRRFRWPRALSVPVVWVAVEWFRVTFTLAHFDLYPLGYSQARVLPLVQIADLTGVYGVSFVVAMVNGLVADAIVGWRARRGGPDVSRSRPRLAREALAVAGVIAACLAYGVFRLEAAADTDGPRVAIVQPNVEHTERNTVGVHLSEVLFTEERVPAGAADLIVWPENSILDNVRRPGLYLPDLARLAREKGAFLLVGGMGKVASDPGRTTNTAFLVDARGAILGETSKRVLFPWSERIPADAFLRSHLQALWRLQRKLVRLGWGFVPTGIPGERTNLLELPWGGSALPFGVLICVENTYPPIPAEQARLGARFLCNITSERQIGGPVQEQLLRISMLRAVENRIAYVRCGNSGISGVVDPEGRLRGVLRGDHGGTIFDSGVLVERVRLGRGGATPYARSHDAFALACVALTLALFVAARARRPGAAALALVGIAAVASACAPPPRPGADPRAAPAELARGRALLSAGDPKGAIAPLAAACGAPEPCREAIPLLSAAFLETKRFEDADAFFAALASRPGPLEGAALAERGRFLDRLADLREAESVTAEAAKLDPRPETWTALGTLRLRIDEPDAALDAYGRALAAEPDDPQVRYLHARALWLAGRSDAAVGELTGLLRDRPDMGAAWAVLGRLREAAGDEVAAVQAYREAIRGDPDNVEARLMLARDALSRGRPDEAKRLLAEIWAINTRAVASTAAR